MAATCRHCRRPIERIEDAAIPLGHIHHDTRNSFCDVTGAADAVEHRRTPPQERYEAEPGDLTLPNISLHSA